MPQRHAVVSSNIRSLGYDPATEELDVEFSHSGAVYRVSGVSFELHEKLIGAPSIGRAYNEHIRKAGLLATKVQEAECSACGAVGVVCDACDLCGCGSFGGERAHV